MIPLSTDWLSLSVRLLDDVQRAPAHHRWQIYEGGTNVWQRRRCLFNERGEKVLTLLSHPKSSLIDPSQALVEIANEWLYHGLGVRAILTKLKWCVPFEITGLSRLDLAVDFVPSHAMERQIIQLATGSLEVSGKQNGSGFWSVNTADWVPEQWKGRRCPHDMNWGHKETDVKWKLYYKTKELRDAAGGSAWDKPYIVDLWRECGLDIWNVWRLEVSMKRCNKLLINGRPLTLDDWGNNTKSLFESLYTSRFQLSHGGNRAKRRRVEHIPFLPVHEAHAVKCRHYDGNRTSSARIGLLRKLIAATEEDEVRFDSPTLEETLKLIDGIVLRDNLQRYFEGMTGENYVTWRQRMITFVNGERMPLAKTNTDVFAGLSPNLRWEG